MKFILKQVFMGTIVNELCQMGRHRCARPCSARLRTQLGPDYRNPVVLGQHNHLGNPMIADVLQTRHEMKERVQQQLESVSSVIYREQLLQAPLEVAALIPSKETVGRALRYQHSKLRPSLPATAADLQLHHTKR